MDLFPFTKDIQAFLLRATASLERLDNTAAEAQMLIREVRSLLAGIRAGVSLPEPPQKP